jgi:iron uptake system component EfeO
VNQPIPTRILLGATALGALAIALGACGSEADPATEAAATGESTTAAARIDPALLDRAVSDYDAYVEAQTGKLVRATDRFVAAVASGDQRAAEAAYPGARVHFERVEPVAGAFGDLDPDIDAREGDVPKADWGGFHVIEKALWVDATTDGLEHTARELTNDVASLHDSAVKADFDPVEIAQGSVDLMAEVSSSKITGEEERYSHTDLWDFQANVEGAEAGFHALEPALEQADPALEDRIEGQFDRMHELLDQYRKGDGFVYYDTLTEKQTKELSQQVDALAESLSEVPPEVG